MIGRAVQRIAGIDNALQNGAKGRAVGIKDRRVIKAGGPRRGRLAALAVPGVEADVMVIPPGGQENGTAAIALRDLKAEDAGIEGKRTVQVGHLEVDMADPGGGRGDVGHGLSLDRGETDISPKRGCAYS